MAAFVVTLDGVIAGWGVGVASLLGYGAEEVIGRDVSMFLPGEHPSGFPRILAAAARGQRIETLETMVGRDGVRLQAAMSLDCALAGVSAVARDVTEDVLAQEALADSQARLRDTEALARVGHWVWDVGTGAVQWSEGLHRIFGIDPVHFGGTLEAHLEAIHPADRERVLEAMRQSVTHASPFSARYRILRPDGTTKWLESRADMAPGPSPGTVAGLRGICQELDPGSTLTTSLGPTQGEVDGSS